LGAFAPPWYTCYVTPRKASSERLEFYGGDPLLIPLYSVHDVAHHLRLPASSVRQWTRSQGGVIVPADRKGEKLSFQNLSEVHVLSVLRGYHLPLRKIRGAIQELRVGLKTEHPLAEVQLETDRKDIFAWVFGTLVAVTGDHRGQVAIRPVLAKYLERIERERGQLLRLYPLVKGEDRSVAIDPRRRFGKPYLVELGVETSAIASRYRAGESVRSIAKDFDASTDQIKRALRFEQLVA
jgi:uncharacterized protein (DUF433 family)